MSEHVSAAGMWGGKSENEIRRDLIREMNRLSVVRLEGSYSGGHDEGGLETLNVFDRNDESVSISHDHPLYQAVDDLLSTKFYTWALECYVYGKVFVDLKAKRAWTEGQEEIMQYVEDADPIDMRW